MSNYKDKEEEKKCPDCDGVLLLREGQYGFFCEDYPECKYTERATEEDIEGFDENDVEYND